MNDGCAGEFSGSDSATLSSIGGYGVVARRASVWIVAARGGLVAFGLAFGHCWLPAHPVADKGTCFEPKLYDGYSSDPALDGRITCGHPRYCFNEFIPEGKGAR